MHNYPCKLNETTHVVENKERRHVVLSVQPHYIFMDLRARTITV